MSTIAAVLVATVLALFSITPAMAAKKVCRDAKTGAFVSTKYAKRYPGLTVCETKTDLIKKKQG